MASQIAEFVEFLSPLSRTDVKNLALETLLKLTSSRESRRLICENETLLESLIRALEDLHVSSTTTLRILINLSSDECGTEAMLRLTSSSSLLESVLRNILTKGNELELLCSLLNNLSRTEVACVKLYPILSGEDLFWEKLVDLFCESDVRCSSQLHHLAGVLANLCQLADVRKYFLHEGKNLFVRLLPFTTYENSVLRRSGIAGMIKNCCFDAEFHDILFSDDVDVLPHILLPLAGPEEFTDDEMAELPIELQYLGETKQREPDHTTRKKHLEALAQLCTTKTSRDYLRKKQVYLILRELHKWEKEPTLQLSCEDVVQILIRDESDLEMVNLKKVEIPEQLVKKFQIEDERDLSCT